MQMAFRMTYSGPVPRNVRPRLRRLQIDSFDDMGTEWFRTMRPHHFTTEGAKEYGYAKRTKGYMIRKARRKHHQRPLVYSGQSEQLARRGRIVATSKGVRVILPTRALNLKRSSNSPDMQRELRTISAREQRILVRRFDAKMQHGLNGITDKVTVNIHGSGQLLLGLMRYAALAG